MANGRRRDEWDRFGQLMSLVWNRTAFGEKDKGLDPIDFWPPGLIEQSEAAEIKRPQKVMTVPMSVIQKMVLG
jgi:hypothetical protein